MSLKGVRHVLSAGHKFVAPDVALPIESAARGEFKFGFRGQTLAGPLAVSNGVFVGDLHNRLVHPIPDVRGGTFRMSPVGAVDILPPLKVIVQLDSVDGRREDYRAFDQILGRGPWVVFGPWF